MSETEPNDTKKFIVIALCVAAIIILMWVGTLFLLIDYQDRGVFGDMFGSVNALFSGLALAGIILTILLQRNELALQRQELKETRAELKRSAVAQEKSEQALNRQAENLKVSAELTALNSLLVYYTTEIHRLENLHASGNHLATLHEKKVNLIHRIEEILKNKDGM